VTQFTTSDFSQQSRDVLDTSQKDERRHILGFVGGDSPAHKSSMYGSGSGSVLAPPPPPPRPCLAVTRALPDGQVQTTLSEDCGQVSAAGCWTGNVDRRTSTTTTSVDEGF